MKLHNYKGINGWYNIINSKIDFSFLKQINQKKFKNVNNSTNIDCEILFYSPLSNDNAIIHLGISKNTYGYYFPRTFFVEKVSNKNNDIYISNQEHIDIYVKKRVILI